MADPEYRIASSWDEVPPCVNVDGELISLRVLEKQWRDARSVLNQIGWFRDDTQFMSLNLTLEQREAIDAACALSDRSPEEVIATSCLIFVMANPRPDEKSGE